MMVAIEVDSYNMVIFQADPSSALHTCRLHHLSSFLISIRVTFKLFSSSSRVHLKQGIPIKSIGSIYWSGVQATVCWGMLTYLTL